MPGGILQLVANNIENSILTDEPQITLFKTVYKRHTNYSFYDHKILLNNALKFGSKSYVKLRNFGDLLHKIILVIELPEVKAVFKILTKPEIKQLLFNYGIIINFDDIDTLLNDDDLVNISNKINVKISELQILNTKFESMVNILEINYDYEVNVNVLATPITNYYNNIINSLIPYEDNGIFYNYITAYINDNNTAINLVNSDMIQLMLFDIIRSYCIENNTSTYLDEIYKFIANIEFGKYNLNVNNNIITIFNLTIDNIYKQANITDYVQLDSYKLYSNFLDENIIDIYLNTDLLRIKSILINDILSNLKANYTSLLNTFNVLKNRFKITIMKPIRTQRGVNLFDITLPFISISLVEDVLTVNDNISSYFNYDTSLSFTHYYGKYISSHYNTFLKNILTDIQNISYSDYFKNDITTLWRRLAVTTVMSLGSTITNITELNTVYLLNFIPILLLEDIPKLILDYLDNTVGIGDVLYTTMDTEIQAINIILLDIIKTNIVLNIDEIMDLITLTIANKKSSTDVLITTVMRQEFLINSIKTIMDYLYEQYYNTITLVITICNITNTTIIDNLTNILNSFFTYELPTYATYKNNGYRIYNAGTSNNVPVFDAASIIWYTIQKQFKLRFNNLYYTKFLDKMYYTEKMGIEFLNYVNNIIYNQVSLIPNNYKVFDTNNELINVDYYNLSSNYLYNNDVNITNIINFINDKNILNDIYALNYSKYKQILKIKNIPVIKSQYFYNTKTIIIDNLYSIVQNNSLYGYDGVINNDLNTFLTNARIILNNQNNLGILDICNEYRITFLDVLASNSNIYNINTNLYDWYIYYNINTISPLNKSILADEFNNITNNLSAVNLYKDLSNIYTNFNKFATNIDVFNYIKQLIFTSTTYIGNFKSLLYDQNINNEINIKVTYENIYNYVLNLQVKNENMLTEIDSSVNLSEPKLLTKIKQSQTEHPAEFAWIPELGHFIIDTITLKIGDQVIDTHTGEWLHLENNLSLTSAKLKGYNNMIGNIKLLTDYNIKQKPKYTLFIPLLFWFCKRSESSLPMTALHLTDVTMEIKLKDSNILYKLNKNAIIKSKLTLDSYLIAQYIYLDTKERELIATSRHEYLIEIMQINSFDIINYNNLINNNDIYYLNKKIYFNNLCKEFIFGLKKMTSAFNDYTFYSNKNKRNINMCNKIKIQFNGKDRETYKDGDYYNLCIPHKTHLSILDIGKYSYNFALYPEYLQPSGTANLSQIDDMVLSIILHDEVIQDMKNNNLNLIFTMYARSYNILRIFSGMAGLTFI